MDTPAGCILPMPFHRSCWVVPGQLLAGCYPGSVSKAEAEQKLDALIDAGIRCVVTLVEEDETNQAGQPMRAYAVLLAQVAAEHGVAVTYSRIPVRDLNVPSTATMHAILDAVDAACARGQPIYVHCWGGRGRTGTVVGCWLARHGLALGEEALARNAVLRSQEPTAHLPAPGNHLQRSMVREWRRGQ
jgi:protein tyrosine phosphatase (PTP) superfamily phosphohydrolase (DUF442 family)